jgi:hypothetical protein
MLTLLILIAIGPMNLLARFIISKLANDITLLSDQ